MKLQSSVLMLCQSFGSRPGARSLTLSRPCQPPSPGSSTRHHGVMVMECCIVNYNPADSGSGSSNPKHPEQSPNEVLEVSRTRLDLHSTVPGAYKSRDTLFFIDRSP
ncbi:hypothetical protein LY78DRAFT_82226 [Colletotrichum sublineola]|nr:hypothetical protein LY78DRAFT_82226 [Colletotrichum sublineola]